MASLSVSNCALGLIFETDKEANYTLQEDITLSVYNKINEDYEYDFNDTNTLLKDKAIINNEIYESPKNERRGRDEIDNNESNKKRKIAKVATKRYTLNDFVDSTFIVINFISPSSLILRRFIYFIIYYGFIFQ